MTKYRTESQLEFWIPTSLLVAGLIWFLVLPTLRNVIGSWAVSSWSETTGQVIASRSYRVYIQQRQQTNYNFKYKYRVGPSEFQSRRYSFRYASGDQRLGVAKYGQGDEITVYYDPENPGQSVVDRDLNPWWNYLVLGFLVVVPIALLIRWKAARQLCKSS